MLSICRAIASADGGALQETDMVHRAARTAARGWGWARDRVLDGVSRICLEAVAFWSVLCAAGPRVRSAVAPRRAAVARIRPPSPAPAPRSRGFSLALDAALVGATVYVVVLMHREVCAQMLGSPEHRARVEDVRLALRPAWAPRETVSVALAVDRELSDLARGNPPGLVAEVARRLQRDPWVRRVVQVRRLYPDRIEATLELRRPLGRVWIGRRSVLVSEDGVRLPDLRDPATGPGGCYEITGVDGAAPAVGATWNHAGVRAALDVAQALDRHAASRAAFIAQIDVANIGGRRDARRSEIVCRTASGVAIEWGRPPSTAQFGENPVDVKVEQLLLALRAFPGLHGVESVSLRFDRVVVRPRPEWRGLAAADAPVGGRAN